MSEVDNVTKSDTANEESQALDQNKSSDIANTDTANEESKAMDQEGTSANIDKEKEVSAAKEDTAPEPEGAGNEETPEPKKGRSGKLENRDAIPTAGGERLGEKHWGDSEIVPDLPPKRESEGGQGVSSAEGQPDKATQDNTTQNTGGAAPPSSSTADSGEKTSIKDKIKEKLNIGSSKD